MKINIITVLLSSIVLLSCSGDKSKAISYDTPQSLVGNVKVETYFETYAELGGEVIVLTTRLSDGSGILKMAALTTKISKAADKISQLEATELEIVSDLSEKEKADFERVIYTFEKSIGQRRIDVDAIDESEMAAINNLKKQQQVENANETLVREEAIAQVQGEISPEDLASQLNTSNEPKFTHIVFPILIMIGFAFGGYFFYKKIKNKLSEVGYAMSDAKKAVNKAKQMVADEPADGRKLSKDEKSGLDFLDKFLKN